MKYLLLIYLDPAWDKRPVAERQQVYGGQMKLAEELTALRAWHLWQIIRDYSLVDESDVRIESMSERELGSLIMQRVRALHP